MVKKKVATHVMQAMRKPFKTMKGKYIKGGKGPGNTTRTTPGADIIPGNMNRLLNELRTKGSSVGVGQTKPGKMKTGATTGGSTKSKNKLIKL